MEPLTELIEPQNRKQLESHFLKLQPNTLPIWGKMTPQQMVEHLIDQVQYTNGKKEPFCEVPEEEANKAKQINIYTNVEIPRNVVFGTAQEQLLYPSLSAAIQQLMAELDDFDQYFTKPGRTAIHGGFGPMNYKEWLIWHDKHFFHHLKQFGLI
ncbi:hypothetical protein [Pedobacter nutrimenti]|uniref:hypothetical protein n=1 Tax=Pedobacter nutrimenti TaxID=1241337 RepID=UPI0029302BD1|nr:hypothetical protein [Pedobacter nutrimenti]